MTTLDERLRDAEDALGDPPPVAPPFDGLRRRHRQRRRRAMTVGAGALSIVVACVVVAFAVRDRSTQSPAATTPSVATSTSTKTSPAAPVQRLEDMPRLPASAVQTVQLSQNVGAGRAVLDGGSLWLVSPDPGCSGQCAWLTRVDPLTGAVQRLLAPPLASPGGGFIAIGDGAVFVATFEYDGSPIHLRRIDLATQRTVFTVDVPDTRVYGTPKARIAFGNGALWFSEGAHPVVKFDPRTGRVLATIPVPHNGAETTGYVGFAFSQSGAWLVGGDTGTTLIHIDQTTNEATAANSFGNGFSQSLAADGRYVWTTHWATHGDTSVDLARVDAADSSGSDTARIPTPQVAAGDGQVWFLGYTPSDKSADAANHYGVVGRVDPETMKVIGVTELPDIGALDDPQLFVADGSAWVYNASTRTITRITTP